MARKSVERSLPRLREVFPDFRAMPKAGHRLNITTGLVRDAARKLRRSRNQTFYSMREMAAFLSVPLRTVELAYEKLAAERLLVRVRGSRTVLLGKVFRSEHPARSVVSMPMRVLSLQASFACTFFSRISEELRRHHFVVNQFLYTARDFRDCEFTSSLWKQADIVIWLFPTRIDKESILMLHDHGVQTILLLPGEHTFLPAHYLMDWTPTYREVIRAWRTDGIRHIVVPMPGDPHSQKVITYFLRLLQEEGCTHSLAEANISDLRAKVDASLKKKVRTGCAVLEYELADQLCNCEPVATAQLTTRCRVLFGRGIVRAPWFFNRDFRADVIGFSGEETAMQVARGLRHSRWEREDDPVRFSPRWRPQADLGKVFA